MQRPVFISFSSKDGELARRVCVAVEARGVGCWISSRDVDAGENYQEAIVDAIRKAKVMILVFSSNANYSNEIKKELSIASQAGIAVMPVRVEDVAPSGAFAYELSTRQWIDLFSDWDNAIDRLTNRVRMIVDAVSDTDGSPAPRPDPTPRPTPKPAPSRAPLFVALGALALLAAGGGAWWWRQANVPDGGTVAILTPPKADDRPAPSAGPTPRARTTEPASRPTSPAKPAEPPDKPAQPPAPHADDSPRAPVAEARQTREEQTPTAPPPAAPTPARTPSKPTADTTGAPHDEAAPVATPVAARITPPPATPVSPSAPAIEQPAIGPPPGLAEARAGMTFRECEQCPAMVVIPAGQAVIGSSPSESGHEKTEEPRRSITFARAFALGRDAVTFDEWNECVAEGGCGHFIPTDMGWGRGDRPAIFISWNDARAYADWLSKKTGATYRLPSESEWEYAARACLDARCRDLAFWFGPTIAPERANYDWRIAYPGGSRAQSQRRTMPTLSNAPNAFGLYNVLGNVAQWVEDCWNPDLKATPADGSPATSGACGQRVIRGGSWADDPTQLRSAARKADIVSSRQPTLGFRIARGLDNETRATGTTP